MIMNIKKYLKENSSFLLRTGAMLSAAMADSALTVNNIQQYGIDAELNPVIKETIHYSGEWAGVVLPKIFASGYTIFTAKKTKNYNYMISGEELLNFASLIWSLGTFANIIDSFIL